MTIQIIATIISSLITGFILTRFGYRLGVSDNKIIASLSPLLPLLLLLPLPFLLTSFTDSHHLLDYLILLLHYYSLRLGSSLQPIGLTGSIATGKSTVSTMLRSTYSQPIVDVDSIAHSILLPSHPLGAYAEVVSAFGTGILSSGPSSTIDRTALGAVIFSDASKRRVLNKITHPKIRRCMLWGMVHGKVVRGERQVWVDVPLLFESPGLRYLFGAIVLVSTTKELQRE
ncbi:hypothetical protein TrRE_jg3505, partial [Triparma retinervis]